MSGPVMGGRVAPPIPMLALGVATSILRLTLLGGRVVLRGVVGAGGWMAARLLGGSRADRSTNSRSSSSRPTRGAGHPLKSARICGFRLGIGVGGTPEAMAELTEGIVGKLQALAPALPEVL
ncbi:MAG: hypothetical protein ACR2GX_03255 [Candidatus Dormibacteria bacterium]